MDSGNYIPDSGQGRTSLEGPQQDLLSSLDILYANECECSVVPKQDADRTEAYFYRGGKAQWLNFYLAEKVVGSHGQMESLFVRRDGYKRIVELVDKQRQGRLSVSTVHLFHEPGSGGSTLAMQVLWDFRKKLRCAVLRDSSTKAMDVAQQTINLFREGGPTKQNTVLLLIDDLPKTDTLHSGLVECIANSPVDTDIPIVIILKCERIIGCDSQFRNGVTLKRELSQEEQDQFKDKETQLHLIHGEQSRDFHGFNIMRHNFSEEYVQGVINGVLAGVQIKARNIQLLSFLALLNSYVPGSSLVKSECEAFLGPPAPIDGGPPFEERMGAFTGLLVTFSRREKLISHDRVRMVHPLIATQCCQYLATCGLTLSQTTKNLLENFDKEKIDKQLPLNISELLVKRTTGEQFSPLIESIRKKNNMDCVNILEFASGKFPKNAFIPQALARFLYLSKLHNYPKAEKWAREAIRRASNNSFIADTLGQLHKNHLKWEKSGDLSKSLDLAQKAVTAFKEQQKLAEKEDEVGMEDESMTRKSNFFNHRGLFGHIQVANIVFDKLACLPNTKDMTKILTLDIKITSLRGKIKNEFFQTLLKFKTFITALKPEVESIFAFFELYLTHSKPKGMDYDPPYLREQVTECFLKYAKSGNGSDGPTVDLKMKTAASFPGLLHCLYRKERKAELTHILELWKWVVCQTSATPPYKLCYVLSNIALHCVHPKCPDVAPLPNLAYSLHNLLKCEGYRVPELYFLAVMLLWLEKCESHVAKDGCHENHSGHGDLDLNFLVKRLEATYEVNYQKHLRSRYILPHFFLKKGTGLDQLVHRSALDLLIHKLTDGSNQKQGSGQMSSFQDQAFHQWRNQAVWENDEVQGCLLRVQGVVQDRKVFAYCGKLQIQVHTDNAAQVHHPGSVSFYLGFTMRGPVALDIQYHNDLCSTT